MKMSPERYAELKEGIRQMVDHHGKAPTEAEFKGKTLTRMMWAIFHAVLFDWQYEDTHPAYAAGKVRVLPHKDHNYLNGKLYGEGLNDSHIETALKKIAKELGLQPAA